MARRAGKAASRKARQRNVPRQPRPVAPPPPTDESVSAEPSSTVVSASAAATAPSPGPRRFATAGPTSLGSTLTDHARSEYHYVERDLRNIGILTAIMVALLLAAWALFSATGLIV